MVVARCAFVFMKTHTHTLPLSLSLEYSWQTGTVRLSGDQFIGHAKTVEERTLGTAAAAARGEASFSRASSSRSYMLLAWKTGGETVNIEG